jgi:hypothetical protein
MSGALSTSFKLSEPPTHLARIIDTNDGKWTCEKPIFKDVEEEDGEDEDDAKNRLRLTQATRRTQRA